MTGEYNTDLQRAAESAGVTIEPNTRYEWADGLKTFGTVVSGIFKNEARNRRGGDKEQQIGRENEYAENVQRIITEHMRNPNRSTSELHDKLAANDRDFYDLSPATKNNIRGYYKHSYPDIPSLEAEKLTTAAQAKKQSELDEKYISLTNATYNQDELANMSTAFKVEEGRRIAAENWISTKVVPEFLRSQIPDWEKYTGVEMTVDTLTKAIGRDIQNELKKGVSGKLDQWWNQRKIAIREQLLADGYPPQYADFALWKATQDYDPMFTDIKQGREDAVKYAQQVASHRYDIAKAKAIEATGTIPEIYIELNKNYTYLNDEQKRYVELGWGNLANSAIDLTTQQNWNTPQQIYDNQEFYFSDPLTTANQRMNASNKGMGAMNAAYEEAVKNGQNKSKDYQDAMSMNTRMLVEQINNNAASWSQAYSENATKEQRAYYDNTFNTFLQNAIANDLAKLGRDAIGAVSYKDGLFQSNNKLDRQRINELNGLLGNLRNINKTLGGNLFKEADLTKMIQQGIADNALIISNIGGYSPGVKGFGESILDDLTSAGMFAWAAAGRLMGDNDYEALALSPRQAVLNQRNREKNQENAVQLLRQSRAEQYLGKGAIPAPADDRGFLDFLGSAVWNVSTAPIRGVYNAPAWMEQTAVPAVTEAAKKVPEVAKQAAERVKRGYKIGEELYGNLKRNLHNIVGPEEATSITQAKKEASEYFKDEWKDLSEARKEVLSEVVYQLRNDTGITRNKEASVTIPLALLQKYIEDKDYARAGLNIQSKMRKYMPEPDARALGIIFYQGNKIQPDEEALENLYQQTY